MIDFARIFSLLVLIFCFPAGICAQNAEGAENAVPDAAPAADKPAAMPLKLVEMLQQAPAPISNFDLLADRLADILRDSPTSQSLTIRIEDVDSPIMLFEQHAIQTPYPGSLLKVLTTAAALDILGPDYRFRTVVRACGKMGDAGRLDGDLVIAGSGDPSLGFESLWGKPGQPATDALTILARDVHTAGITAVWGRVLGDDHYFDDMAVRSDWPGQIPPGIAPAEISGLSYAGNMVNVLCVGGGKPQRKVSYFLAPATDYVHINGVARTVPSSAEVRPVRIERKNKSNMLTIHGMLAPRQEESRMATVWNGTGYCATQFREALTRQNVTIRSEKAADLDDLAPDAQPSSMTWPVAVHFSPPLREILHTMNRLDSHFHADMIVKTLGRVRMDAGAFDAGGAVIQLFLRQAHLAEPDTVIADGSGLSPRNEVSTRLIVRTLKYMAQHRQAEAMLAALPTPLENGPLADHLQTATQWNPEAAGRIRALSTSLERPGFVTGYVGTASGARFAFVFTFEVEASQQKGTYGLIQRLLMAIAQSDISGPGGVQGR